MMRIVVSMMGFLMMVIMTGMSVLFLLSVAMLLLLEQRHNFLGFRLAFEFFE